MTIHTNCKSISLIFFKCICCHRNDRYACFILIRQASDCLCCFITVHFRHLNIHQDHIICTCRHLFYHIYTLNAILHTFCFNAGTLKDCFCNLCIQIIILCQKDIPAFKDFTACSRLFNMFFYIIAFIGYLMFKCNCNGAALSEFTLYIYCSTKQINIFPDYRHSQSGSCDFALCSVLFTCKCVENLRHIILTHANSCITHSVPHNHVSWLVAWQFIYAHHNRTTGRSIFYSIAQDVDKYFFHLGNICQYMLMFYIHRVMKRNILFPCFLIKYCKQRLPDIFNPAVILIKLHPSTLDPGHIQYIIYD